MINKDSSTQEVMDAIKKIITNHIFDEQSHLIHGNVMPVLSRMSATTCALILTTVTDKKTSIKIADLSHQTTIDCINEKFDN